MGARDYELFNRESVIPDVKEMTPPFTVVVKTINVQEVKERESERDGKEISWLKMHQLNGDDS